MEKETGMSESSSGQWTGFYTYSGHSRRFLMDLVLEFKQGIMSGEGYDGIGGFVIAGVYSSVTHECSWKKTYVGRHTVEYRGFGENNGIWGTWTLLGTRGGFRIWPLSEGVPLLADKEEEPVQEQKKSPQPVGKPV